MQGVRSTLCPRWLDDIAARRAHSPSCELCQGNGRVKLDATKPQPKIVPCSICEGHGTFLGDICFRCKGLRAVERVVFKVNPAGIRSTRSVGGQNGGDVLCGYLDDLITGWRESDATIWLNRVVVREYCYNGKQTDKALQLKVSESFYKKRLRDVYEKVEVMLNEKMP